MMKTRILEALKDKNGDYLSGGDLSVLFDVSRTAIWKAIKQLRDEGYNIESSSRKGYRLVDMSPQMTQEELNIIFKEHSLIERVEYHRTIDSTNIRAKELGANPKNEVALIIADEQTAGRGRLGRKWVSPQGVGLYSTILLYPSIPTVKASRITLIAAAAMAEAIRQVTSLEVGIKWPNDIVINQKKICGILTEMNAEMNAIHYLMVGAGVNVGKCDYPEEVSQVATSIEAECGHEISRIELMKVYVEKFSYYYDRFVNDDSLKEVIEVNRKFSVTIHKTVQIISRGESRLAEAISITEDGELVVINESGNEEVIFYGEVSVRGLKGYY